MEAAVLTGVRSLGLSALPWSDDLARLRHRVAFARAVDWRTAWPDLGDAALLASLETWLQPYIAGITRRSQFGRIDLRAALSALLPWPLPNRLDDIAPARVVVPSGSAIDVDYGAEGGPALAVKLQEVFGQSDTPTVGGEARVAVTLHLLSPARRPLAVTRDLASFWRNAYTAVRAEMRGRYPKHVWPENPMAATPTRRSIKPRA
jgi:ATP-dependent helicase HrpB